MGLRNGSSAGVVMADLVTVVEEFERTNSVRLELRGELTTWKGRRDIQWTAAAFGVKPEDQGKTPLAYTNVRCMERRLVTMEAVLLQLLYALDFQLALRELPEAEQKG